MAPRTAARSRTTSRSSTGRGGGEKIATEQLGAVLSTGSANGLEEHLLALLLQRDELREYAEAMPAEHFLDTVNREMFTAWRRLHTLEEITEAVSSDLAETLGRLRSAKLQDSDLQRRIDEVTQCVRRMRERYLRHVLQAAEMALQEQEQSVEGEERESLRNKTLDPSDHLRKLFKAGATGRR
jgi:hypothetical protein